MRSVTKAELEEYVEELEDAIEEAFDALDNDKLKKAQRILSEYVEQEEEPEEEQEPEQENG